MEKFKIIIFFFELKFLFDTFFLIIDVFVLRYLRYPIIQWDIRVCIDLIIYAIYIYIYIISVSQK